MGLRAPGAGDAEPGAAGPRAEAARELAEAAASARSVVGGGGPRESFFAARGVGALRGQTRPGLWGLRSGCWAGEGARRLEEVCVCARSRAGRSPLRAACVAAAALVAGFGKEGEGARGEEGEGELGSGEKLASAWVRADGAGGGERGALRTGGDAGRSAGGRRLRGPGRCTQPGRAPATPVSGFRSRRSHPSSRYLQKNPAARLCAGSCTPTPISPPPQSPGMIFSSSPHSKKKRWGWGRLGVDEKSRHGVVVMGGGAKIVS